MQHPLSSSPAVTDFGSATQPGSGPAKLVTLSDLIQRFSMYSDEAAIVALNRSGSVVTHTYAQLSGDISRLTAALVRSGLSGGKLIMLWAPNSPEWVVAYFSIVAAGNIVIPLDDQTSAEGVEVIQHQCGPACVFTSVEHLPSLDAAGVLTGVRRVLLDGDGTDALDYRRLCAAEIPYEVPAADPDAVACLLYTSGTTGTPKGVPLTHANLMSNVRALLAANIVASQDNVLVPLPLHHGYPATVGMLCAFGRGATLVLPSGISGPELTAAARAARATILVGVPRLYHVLLESIDTAIRSSGFGIRVLLPLLLRMSIVLRRRLGIRVGRVLFSRIHRRIGAGLRIMVSGGAKLEPELAWKLEGLGWEVLTGYGLTETSPVVTFNAPGRKRLDSQGMPLSGVEIKVEKAPAEPYGEIQVKGPNVFSGYRMNDRANREAFTASGWFRTGDLGYLDQDGYLHVVGRKKEIIVLSGGKNVSPEEVERVYEASPCIREVAVLEERGSLAALVVPDDEAVRHRGAMSEESLLRDELENVMLTMPSYQRIAEYRLTRRALPRTRLGKLRRHLLPGIFEEAAAAEARTTPAELSEEDRQLLGSATVNAAWNWLRERYPDSELSLDSSPQLDLGIDSLTWVSVTSELEQTIGIAVRGEALSRVLTVRDLLHAIDDASSELPLTTRSELEQAGPAQYLENPSLPLRILGCLLLRFNRIAMRSLFRLRVKGIDRLPADGPFVITPNHSSYLDPPAIAAALPDRLLANACWAGRADTMHKGPIFRAISRSLRVFPVDPDRDLGGSIQLAAQAMDDRRVLVWFPEGRRSPDGVVGQFRRGIGVLLKQSRALVVPVRIEGSFQAWPQSRKWPRPRRITVVFGAPQTVDSLLGEEQRDTTPTRVSDALKRCVTRLRS